MSCNILYGLAAALRRAPVHCDGIALMSTERQPLWNAISRGGVEWNGQVKQGNGYAPHGIAAKRDGKEKMATQRQ